MRRFLVVLAGLVVGSLVFTWWALESSGVAVVTTQSAGGPRSTHVWFVEHGGLLLIEAGTPENGWFVDIQLTPELRFSSDLTSGAYVARALPNPAGHRRIRSLLRERYGIRDRWIGLLFDTSRSIAVQLTPVE